MAAEAISAVVNDGDLLLFGVTPAFYIIRRYVDRTAATRAVIAPVEQKGAIACKTDSKTVHENMS